MTLQECKCLSNFNEMLKEHNTEIDITFSIPRDGGPMRAFPKISTSKIESRKRVGPVIAAPTFCPFCGQRYGEQKESSPAETTKAVGSSWTPVDQFQGPTGLGNTVLVAVTGGGKPSVVGEAYFDPEAYDGTWWWAGTALADYHSSPVDEIMHGKVSHFMALPAAPGEGA